jgi:hypothetical protein
MGEEVAIPIARLLSNFLQDNMACMGMDEAEKLCYRFAASLAQFDKLSLPDGTPYIKYKE